MELVRTLLRQMIPNSGQNLMDYVFSMLEQYANSLEQEVEERTKELVEEKRKRWEGNDLDITVWIIELALIVGTREVCKYCNINSRKVNNILKRNTIHIQKCFRIFDSFISLIHSSDILLYRMLPRQVADKLKLGESVEPESFEHATIFFSDVVSFTTLAGKCTPLQVMN